MFFSRSAPRVEIETDRLTLRPPELDDFGPWRDLRRDSRDFLEPWEPNWAADHLTRRAFRNRVSWARRAIEQDRGAPLFAIRRDDRALIGAVTVDHIRRGPAQSATVGYWIGRDHSRRGYMAEALVAVKTHVFETLDLSRLEAACLPENRPSRALLERCGFKYEGVAQAYLQINGRWRNHVLYSALRSDRRGRTEAG